MRGAAFLGMILMATAFLQAQEAKLTVHLLDHRDLEKSPARFWIDWSKKWRGIVQTEEASPEQAAKVIAILRTSLLKTLSTNLCGHDPIYGIEAVDEEGKVLKTSLCFSCLTWVQPGKRLAIAGQPGSSNELCKALREIVEIPEVLRDPEVEVKDLPGGAELPR
jgi:hypothetical protein